MHTDSAVNKKKNQRGRLEGCHPSPPSGLLPAAGPKLLQPSCHGLLLCGQQGRRLEAATPAAQVTAASQPLLLLRGRRGRRLQQADPAALLLTKQPLLLRGRRGRRLQQADLLNNDGLLLLELLVVCTGSNAGWQDRFGGAPCLQATAAWRPLDCCMGERSRVASAATCKVCDSAPWITTTAAQPHTRSCALVATGHTS